MSSATAASMASVVSVVLLMWLRTSMSYQHVKGLSLRDALQELYAQGGVARFYRGMIPALCMMPLSRFGDIFSNELSRELLSDSFRAGIVTMFASSLAACWRILITPADTMKTMMQVSRPNSHPEKCRCVPLKPECLHRSMATRDLNCFKIRLPRMGSSRSTTVLWAQGEGKQERCLGKWNGHCSLCCCSTMLYFQYCDLGRTLPLVRNV